jgi:hypothetical protein
MLTARCAAPGCMRKPLPKRRNCAVHLALLVGPNKPTPVYSKRAYLDRMESLCPLCGWVGTVRLGARLYCERDAEDTRRFLAKSS